MLGEFRIACSDCGWAVIQKAEAEAIAAWNRVMRPRPVVTMVDDLSGGCMVEIGARNVGCLVHQRHTDEGWVAADYMTNEQERGTRNDARAWLIAKLKAAGFDVKEPTDEK
jgi:hypothetical protein